MKSLSHLAGRTVRKRIIARDFGTHLKIPLISAHADGASAARGLHFGLGHYPYLVYAGREGYDESAHIRRIV